MLRALRHCLLLMLMLTVPVQGVSAALMAAMGQHHESGMTQSAISCHEDGAAMADDSSPHPLGKPAPAKSKVCSTCCAGVMAASEVVLHPVARPARHFGASERPSPEGIIPDGLERPPRRLS